MRELLTPCVLCLWSMGTLAQHDHGGAPPPVPSTGGQRPAMRAWTMQPLLLPAMARGGDRAAAMLRPMGIEATEVQVSAADGPVERRRVAYPVGPEGARIEAASPMVGNYHWLTARQESAAEVRVASSAWYFSNPGAAPTELLKQARHELEIVPQPLPREHSGYRESEKWRFLVRWQGQPLGNQPLTLETEFGSRSRYLTDETGIATVLFPRDMVPVGEGGAGPEGRGPRRAKFVLTTERTGDADGKRYLTAFNYSYAADPDRERSLAWGAAFGALGMVAATPLLRRRAAKSNGENSHG